MKKLVVGLGFGDEGKGLVVDWLASKNKNQSVVRYSGGHQVGHCVRIGEEKHIFSNFGSGTMRGLPTFWNCKTVDPFGFCNEYKDLKKYNPKIRIDPNCAVTTPEDKMWNYHDALNRDDGTMGVGFGKTIEREERHYHLFFQDLYHRPLWMEKYKKIKEYHGVSITAEQETSFIESCEKITELVDQNLQMSEDRIYESSQGLMLDMEYGIFPNVTRSKVGTQEIDSYESDEYFLVTRAYQTRHGSGWCSDYRFEPNAPDETNVYNEFQGEFKTRLLDVDLLIYALTIDKGIRESGNRNLVITCLDHMEKYELTFGKAKVEFPNEKSFIDFIIRKIPEMKNIYVSRGPTKNDIANIQRMI